MKLDLFTGLQLEGPKGEPVEIPLRKAAALVAYLAVCPGQAASRETLATLLWGEFLQQRARQSLRQALLALTKTFAQFDGPLLRFESQSVSLAPGAIEVDALLFEELVAKGDPESLERACALYKGEFLEGLWVPATEFETWLETTRTKYRDMAIQCHSDLLTNQEKLGDLNAAIQTAKRALRIDGLREDFHRGLMRLYVARGMRSSALAQFRDCRAILKRELDVVPDEATIKLYETVLEQEPCAPVDPVVQGMPEELPRSEAVQGEIAADFDLEGPGLTVGRLEPLKKVKELLAEAAKGQGHFVSIIGDEGSGKSHFIGCASRAAKKSGALVIGAKAKRAEQSLPFGLWRETLAHVLTPDGAIDPGLISPRRGKGSKTAGALKAVWRPPVKIDGVSRQQLYDATVKILNILSAGRPLAILFDDLQWADDESLGLLAYTVRRMRGSSQFIAGAVCRDQLPLSSTVRRTLGDLSNDGMVAEIMITPLSREDTGKLAKHLKRNADPTDDADIPENEIWMLSEGNPRVISELADPTHSGVIAGGGTNGNIPGNLMEEATTLLARCGKAEKRMLIAACVIGKRCAYPYLIKAARLNDLDAARAIESLVEAAILKIEGEQVSFVRHRVRIAMNETLVGPRRRLEHAAVAAATEKFFEATLEPYFETLAHHFREAGQREDTLKYEILAADNKVNRGSMRAARALYMRVKNTIGATPKSEPEIAAIMSANLGLAHLAETAGRSPEALELYRRVSTAARGHGSVGGLATALIGQSRVLYQTGSKAAAMELAREAVAASKQGGYKEIWPPEDRLITRMHLINKPPAAYIEDLKLHRDRCHSLKLLVDEARANVMLALFLALTGDFSAAHTHCDEAVALADGAGSELSLISCLQARGNIFTWQHDFDRALEHFDQAVNLTRNKGDLPRLYLLLAYRGHALLLADRVEEALSQIDKSIELGQDLNTRLILPFLKTWRAEAQAAVGEDDKALESSLDACRLAADLGQPWAASAAYRALARALALPGSRKFDLANKAIAHAISIQESLALKSELVQSRIVQAKILRAQGQIHRSSDIFSKAGKLFEQMGMNVDLKRATIMAEALRQPGIVNLRPDN